MGDIVYQTFAEDQYFFHPPLIIVIYFINPYGDHCGLKSLGEDRAFSRLGRWKTFL
jgi:hypothetical protein